MRLPRTPETGSLPPREYWLIDPKNEKIETPVDELGLVIPSELIIAVKGLVDPSYNWLEDGKRNVHHFYWYDELYRNETPFDKPNKAYFRNMPINKGSTPLVFHNFTHLVTHHPPVPSNDVIYETIESWRKHRDLFIAAQKTIHNQRLSSRRNKRVELSSCFLKPEFDGVDVEGIESMQSRILRNFAGYEHHFREVQKVPREFRLVDLDESESSIRTLATRLGRIVVPGKHNLVPQVLAA